MIARGTIIASLAIAVVSAQFADASAELYPSRPITMVVPFPAGGPTDAIARIVSEQMSTSLGQPIVMENVTGAAGAIGAGRVARAAPDGYTLCTGFLGTHVLNGAIFSLQYDVVKDFEPVALLASNPQLIVATRAAPAKDLLAQGKSGKGYARNRRCGKSLTRQRSVLPACHGHDVSICPVPRRGPGDAGLGGRACRSDVRSAAKLPTACSRRQHQGVRGHRQEAPCLCA
jgi:tripartite-type tricarboxylate transporter receptor subunit TctC